MEEFLRFDLSLLKETSYRLTCFLLNYFIHYKTYFSPEYKSKIEKLIENLLKVRFIR